MTTTVRIILLVLLVADLLCIFCVCFKMNRIVNAPTNKNRTLAELSALLSPLMRRVMVYSVFLAVIGVVAIIYKLIA